MRANSALARRLFGDARVRTLTIALLFGLIGVVNTKGYNATYPTVASRVKFATTFSTNKAARLFYGTGHNLATSGGYAAWRVGGLLSLFAALFGIFAAVRAIRGEEDNGRMEVVLAGAVSRRSTFVAAMVASLAMVGTIWLATVLGLAPVLPFAGSCFLALAVAAPAVVYVGVGAVAGELMPTRRGALTLAGGVLAADFGVRVVADTVDISWMRWVAPLGWSEQLRAFSGSRSIVLLLPLLAAAVFATTAAVLHEHRDVGAGFVAPRDTAVARPRLLVTPTASALRFERVTIATWTAAVAAFAIIVGSIAKTVTNIGLSAGTRRQFAKFGGIDIASPRGYIGLVFVFFVFAISLFGCGQCAAAREEEAQHRLETLFALPYGRNHWLRGRIGLAACSIALLAFVAGAGTALGTFAVGAQLSMARALEAGANCLPVALLFLGCGTLLFALAPRAGVGLAYAFTGAAFVWELFGALLNAPSWALDLTPFHHLAPTPARPIAWTSAVVMLAIGVFTALAGLVVFRSRDLAGD
jgi:polyether ionophore transport system permease protein